MAVLSFLFFVSMCFVVLVAAFVLTFLLLTLGERWICKGELMRTRKRNW
jgi:hypothetical protein